MGQRVNMHYSIDIEELDAEVGHLLRRANKKLEGLKSFCDEKAPQNETYLSLETLTKIENLRIRMSDIDYLLGDLSEIINGYVRYKVSPPAEDSQNETPELDSLLGAEEEAPMMATPSIDELTSKLNSFRDQLKHEQD